METLADLRVLVLGLGVSGRSAAAFCAARGAHVTVADERDPAQLTGLDALDGRIERALGVPFPDPAGFDLVVPSPGVPPARYRARARRVWGDIELAYRTLAVPIAAVTGTNGKSTTTRLIEAMLCASGVRARAAGNLGPPALGLVGAPLDVAVLEVSSFQLEAVESFRPAVGVVLNVTPDHFDRHADFAEYLAAKRRLFAQQRPEDVAVVCIDDAGARACAEGAPGRVLEVSTRGPVARGAWIDAGDAVLRRGGERPLRLPLAGLPPQPPENRLAALCAATALGADPEKAWGALPSFRALHHRLEPVARRDGVLYVDDSKATNPGAALRAIASFREPLVWIGGGRAKGLALGELADAVAARARAALLMGEAAPELERALAGRLTLERVASIEEAVARAAAHARPGDVVLLAPGCASLDQFRNAEERGDRFRAAAQRLHGAQEIA
jgi:UDP-N-acetylmuramoylalanine--D-glutamate ligase